jgi:tetratricopeptide (TPR) repeat protein
MRAARVVVVMCAICGGLAAAAPAAPPPAAAAPTPPRPPPAAKAADKVDAKALMQSGLKLFAAKDFLGALAVFKTAYARFPSAKILLNIGTTLTRLDRKADAANVYQRYLDAADADPAKRAEVGKVLAGLDAAVATLELAIAPADAELQINDDEWGPVTGVARHRVAPGAAMLRVRHAGYAAREQVVTATAGARLAISIALVALPTATSSTAASAAASSDGVRATLGREPPRARIGVIALAHVDVSNRGGAGVVGISYGATRSLQLQAAAILGPSSGGYAGASLALLDGALRPMVAAGLPIFVSRGARIGLRGAAGVELTLNRHFALIAELGVEYLFNPEADVKRTLFIPAIGAAGRL